MLKLRLVLTLLAERWCLDLPCAPITLTGFGQTGAAVPDVLEVAGAGAQNGATHQKRCMQVCLQDMNSQGNYRDPCCLIRNRIAAYIYSLRASQKAIPNVSTFPAHSALGSDEMPCTILGIL